ncbi:MAG: hypothetical protein ACO32I_01320 [Candidatus Limnocylindrus sp.]
MLVKDYWPNGAKWITWETSSLARAYVDYPYAGQQGYPAPAELAGQLNVVLLGGSGIGFAASIPEGTVWERADNGLGEFDMVARFAVEGHTGSWGVSFYEPSRDGTVIAALPVVGDDVIMAPLPGVSALTTQSLDVYPLEPEYAMPDRWWAYVNGELQLKEI